LGIRTEQELAGYSNVGTTTIYGHVFNRSGRRARRPLHMVGLREA
jgi:site-specific recombinase XerD